MQNVEVFLKAIDTSSEFSHWKRRTEIFFVYVVVRSVIIWDTWEA